MLIEREGKGSYKNYTLMLNDLPVSYVNIKLNEDSIEILYLSSVEQLCGYGKHCILELKRKYPKSLFLGTSRKKYIPFWRKLGAVFIYEPSNEEIQEDALLVDEKAQDIDYIDFKIHYI